MYVTSSTNYHMRSFFFKFISFFPFFLFLFLRYPKIREHTGEYFYANLNFVSPQKITCYLFNTYDDLENTLNILISTHFSSPLKKKNCPIKEAINEMAVIMNLPCFK